MIRYLPIIVSVFLFIGYGAAEAWWTNRWHDIDFTGPVRRLDDIPNSLGGWVSEPLKLTEREISIGQIQSYWYRRYVHASTGKVLTVLLVAGSPGPIAAHTPEVCFAGAGYSDVAEPVRRPFSDRATGVSSEFWTMNFRKVDGAFPDPLRVTWSWTADGMWQAAASPRFSFARYPVLYKLYVIQQLTRLDDPDAKDTCDKFLSLLLPELRRRLFPER
jgi:hypothetical protein